MEKLNSTLKLLDYVKYIIENDAELKKDGDLLEVLQGIDLTIKEFVNANSEIDDATLNSIEEMLNAYLLGSPYSNYEKSVNIVKNIYNKFSDDKNVLEILNKIVKFYNQYNVHKIDIADITKEETKTQEGVETKTQEGVETKTQEDIENKKIIREGRRGRKPKTEKQVAGEVQEGKVEVIREGRRGRRPKVEEQVAGEVQEGKKEIIKERLRDVKLRTKEQIAGEMQEGRKMIKIRESHSNRLLKKYNISIDYDKYLDKFVFTLLKDKSRADQIIKKDITYIFKTHMNEIANFVLASNDTSDIRHRLNTALYAVIKQNLFIINLIVAASKILKEESGGIVSVEINTDKHRVVNLYKKLLNNMLDELINKHSSKKSRSSKKGRKQAKE